MEDSLTKRLEISDDESIQIIRQQTEDILFKYQITDYDVRDSAILFTYEKVIKSYRDLPFEKKLRTIRSIILHYLFTY